MSHKFESGFFVHQAAWHKLGTVLQNPPTTEQAIVEAGLNWRVIEEPLYQVEGNSSEIILKKKLRRDRDQAFLGIVNHDYTPLQNEEAFRWFDPLLSRGGVQLEAAGSLKGGKRIWILAKLINTEAEIISGDIVRPYLLLHNSHDGSTAVWLQFTPVRVVCWNTLNGASRSRFGDLWQKKAICIPHSLSLTEQLEHIHNILDLTQKEFQYSLEEYQAMAHKELTTELLADYIGRVLGTTQPTLHPAWSQLVANFESGRGNQGQTLWDAYNSITQWLDHQREALADARLFSTWFGSGARLRTKAHQVALAMLNDAPDAHPSASYTLSYRSTQSASTLA